MTATRSDVTFIDCPETIRRAWDAYRAAGGNPARYRTERRTRERVALEQACWDTLRRRSVYAVVDGWLLGWAGNRGDRYFVLSPAFRPLLPFSHVEMAHYFQLYRTCPL
jgi:hypothetical protein